MPTKLPTKTICLNCDFEVKTENKYCPNCGQENADKRISLKLLLKDSFETAFNFEARFFQTIPYFLFYPGKLTNEFLEGKRVRYMHPFKIYLLSSILFFFVVIKLFTPALEKSFRNIDAKVNEDSDLVIHVGNSDSKKENKKEKTVLDDLETGFDNYEEPVNLDDSLSDKVLKKITQKQIIIRDSLSKVLASLEKGELNDSTINIDSLQNLVQDSAVLAETILLFDKQVQEGGSSFRKFYRMIQDRKVTPQELLDSINSDNNGSTMNLYAAEQLLKIGRNDPAIFLANIINNIGTIMFVTLPLLAFCFLPFYLRRKKYYIDHLIFTLHLQSFTFIILTLSAIFFHWNLYSLCIILGILLIVYVWFAFKKVYKQGFWKTTIKANIISFLYFNIIVLMLSINLIYSFFMF